MTDTTQVTDERALKSCPFGRDHRVVVADDGVFPIHVRCRDCGVQLFGHKRYFSSVDEAIAAWNRRAPAETAGEVLAQGLRLAISQMDVLYRYAANAMPEHERTIHAAIVERLHGALSPAPAAPHLKTVRDVLTRMNRKGGLGHDVHSWINTALDALADPAPAAPKDAPEDQSESVLIDGVAYDLPAPVAAEMLRLHMLILQSAAPAPEAAHTEAVALSSMPDLQAIVKAGLEDGSLEIRGATSAAPAPEQSDDAQLLDWMESVGDVRVRRCISGGAVVWDVEWGEDFEVEGSSLRNALRAARKAQGGE